MAFLEQVSLAHPLYFFRHGQTDWNRDRRCQGLTDIPLNATGEDQARAYGVALARQLSALDGFRLVASPLARARRTLELIAEAMDSPGVAYETDERLVEIDHGEWCGHTYDEIRAQWPDEYAAMQEDKWTGRRLGGESYEDRLDPVLSFLKEVKGPTIVVGHGGSGRVLRALIAGHPPSQVVHFPMPQDQFYGFEAGRETVYPCAEETEQA